MNGNESFEEEIDDFLPIIIDNGSNNIKYGFCGENNVSNLFPTIIGRPFHAGLFFGSSGNYVLGNEAIEK